MNQTVAELSRKYPRTVRWSDKDDCFLGTCPSLFFGGNHGLDESAVYIELVAIIEDVVEGNLKRGEPLPLVPPLD